MQTRRTCRARGICASSTNGRTINAARQRAGFGSCGKNLVPRTPKRIGAPRRTAVPHHGREHRQERAARRRQLRKEAFDRDGWQCVLAGRWPGKPCWGILAAHPRCENPAGADDLVSLCQAHQAAVEAFPLEARAYGMWL